MAALCRMSSASTWFWVRLKERRAPTECDTVMVGTRWSLATALPVSADRDGLHLKQTYTRAFSGVADNVLHAFQMTNRVCVTTLCGPYTFTLQFEDKGMYLHKRICIVKILH